MNQAGKASTRQEGGDHYKNMAIQPVEFISLNGLGFCEGNVVKYVSRWRSKGGIGDLKKAIHFIELLIEMEERKRNEGKGWIAGHVEEKKSAPCGPEY